MTARPRVGPRRRRVHEADAARAPRRPAPVIPGPRAAAAARLLALCALFPSALFGCAAAGEPDTRDVAVFQDDGAPAIYAIQELGWVSGATYDDLRLAAQSLGGNAVIQTREAARAAESASVMWPYAIAQQGTLRAREFTPAEGYVGLAVRREMKR
ncbi:MAG: hypothetical protein HY719_14460 [Planctomycetes bacterium]|nr:hypothetical protein [Planctomycetota bacterium]